MRKNKYLDKIITSTLCKNFDSVSIINNAQLANYTTFGIGGECSALASIDNLGTLTMILNHCHEQHLPYYILGNGSNLLVTSKGISGVVLDMRSMNSCEVFGDFIYAEAGVSLPRLANIAMQADLSGLEFATNIPGTVGGAVAMNAGAFGSDMSSIVQYVTIWRNNKIVNIPNKNISFNYRKSIFTNAKDCVIIGVLLKLCKSSKNLIIDKMQKLTSIRANTQNVGYRSAGSAFYCTNIPPAYMIEKSGLKGMREGDAAISQKHSGYIVNMGNATSNDVRRLMRKVKSIIKMEWGEVLHPEIIYWGG